MTNLKNDIKIVKPIPYKKKNDKPLKGVIISILILVGIFCYYKFFKKEIQPIPNEIKGIKFNINECNIKDYIIINKDDTYSLKITNDECITNEYFGDIIYNNNTLYLGDFIGNIDENKNIIINNKIFIEEKNE